MFDFWTFDSYDQVKNPFEMFQEYQPVDEMD